MFTATGNEEVAVEAMKTGLDDYILKSTGHYARLPGAVRAALDRAAQRRALQAAQTRYQDLFDRVPIGLYRTQPDGQFLDVNPALVKMLGYPDRETLLTVNALDLYADPDDRERWCAMLDCQGAVRNFQVQMRRYDGQIFWTEDNARAICDDQGQTLYYEGSLQDIQGHKQAEQFLRQRNRELGLLNRASQAFSATLDLDQVLANVLEEVRRLLGVVATSIWLIDDATNELVCSQATGLKKEVVRGWRLTLGKGIAGWVAQNDQSVIVADAHDDERHFKGVDLQTGLALCAVLSVPLRVKRHVIGVLQVVDTQPNRFDNADLELLEPLAASAAIAIENARLYQALFNAVEESDQHSAEILALLKSTRAVLQYQDFDQAVRAIFDACRDLMGATTGYLSLTTETQPKNQALLIGPEKTVPTPESALPDDVRALLQEANLTGTVAYRNDLADRQRSDAPLHFDNLLLAPLVLEEKVDGMLGLANKPDGFTENDARLAAAFSELAAIALRNSQMIESLSKNQNTDGTAQEAQP
jgi:PAS domain S-box-containing protein